VNGDEGDKNNARKHGQQETHHLQYSDKHCASMVRDANRKHCNSGESQGYEMWEPDRIVIEEILTWRRLCSLGWGRDGWMGEHFVTFCTVHSMLPIRPAAIPLIVLGTPDLQV
jgi:hypothetical protein